MTKENRPHGFTVRAVNFIYWGYDQNTCIAPASTEVNLQYISMGTEISQVSPMPNVLLASAPPIRLWINSISADEVEHEEALLIAEAFVTSLIDGLI